MQRSTHHQGERGEERINQARDSRTCTSLPETRSSAPTSAHSDSSAEAAWVRHLRAAELYQSVAPADGLTFRPPIHFPPHERCVEVEVELGLGSASTEVIGADRTHEYISENADYRS